MEANQTSYPRSPQMTVVRPGSRPSPLWVVIIFTSGQMSRSIDVLSPEEIDRQQQQNSPRLTAMNELCEWNGRVKGRNCGISRVDRVICRSAVAGWLA